MSYWYLCSVSVDDVEGGRIAVKHLLDPAAGELAAGSTGERPTAVFAANDLLAVGSLPGLLTAGLRVPDDVP